MWQTGTGVEPVAGVGALHAQRGSLVWGQDARVGRTPSRGRGPGANPTVFSEDVATALPECSVLPFPLRAHVRPPLLEGLLH